MTAGGHQVDTTLMKCPNSPAPWIYSITMCSTYTVHWVAFSSQLLAQGHNPRCVNFSLDQVQRHGGKEYWEWNSCHFCSTLRLCEVETHTNMTCGAIVCLAVTSSVLVMVHLKSLRIRFHLIFSKYVRRVSIHLGNSVLNDVSNQVRQVYFPTGSSGYDRQMREWQTDEWMTNR